MAHFYASEFFILAMPAYLSHHQELVFISGIFEGLGAVGVLINKTRLFSGYGLIILSIAVFPANINMAMHPEKFSNIPIILLYLRLPMQIFIVFFIGWAIKK